MQNVTLSSSFFEESRIKALLLQKDGEAALLLWLRLFFAAVREDGDGTLILYGDVSHDEKSLAALYGLPVSTAKATLELLTKFGLLERGTDHYTISGYAGLVSAEQKNRHRQAQQRYAQSKAAGGAGAKA